MTEQIIILDFGSQYTQVIARRIRECNVYSVILRHDTPATEIAAICPKEDDLACRGAHSNLLQNLVEPHPRKPAA